MEENRNTVYVLAPDGEPLDPCQPVVARLLLKAGDAKVKRKTPFTIKLTREPETRFTHPCTIGVDTGSSTAGFAAVDNKGNVKYASEVTVRNDITKKMDQRRRYRRTRRSRKTRHRKPRFDNRGNSTKKGRYSPTVREKVGAHEREINFIKSILPCREEILPVETGHFDSHLLKNPALYDPDIKKWGYQKGPQYGYANQKEAARSRDGHKCKICGKKTGRLECHHFIWRSNGGPDTVDNLITLCPDCHRKVHLGLINCPKPSGNIKKLDAPTHMNVIASFLRGNHPEVIETSGYITKANRELLGLTKTHYIDAAVIASGGSPVNINEDVVFVKRCVPEGDYQRTKGTHSQMRLPRGKTRGFRKFDKVKYKGRVCFVKGRMSNGYAKLMDIYGNTIDFSYLPKGQKTPKFTNMKRLSARDTVLVMPLRTA